MSMMEAVRPAIPNFRDVGGLPTLDGRRVRTRRLFRSVALVDLDAPGAELLTSVGIRTVFDLRTAGEREHRPDRLPAGMLVVELDVLADGGASDPAAMFALMRDPARASVVLADEGAERFFLAAYRDMVQLPSARSAFGKLLTDLADPAVLPALVHCTTGKDRTGWAVAVLLTFLGVPAEAVMAEYLLSDAAIRAAYSSRLDGFVASGGDRRAIEPFLGVQASFLEAAFDEMRDAFGDVESYVAAGLGLDAATRLALREVFLEGQP